MGKGFDGGLHDCAGFQLEPAIDAIHVAALADKQLPALVSLFHLGVEARWIYAVPRAGGLSAEVLDRQVAGDLHPCLFIDRSAGLLDANLQVADDRRRLEAYLA